MQFTPALTTGKTFNPIVTLSFTYRKAPSPKADSTTQAIAHYSLDGKIRTDRNESVSHCNSYRNNRLHRNEP